MTMWNYRRRPAHPQKRYRRRHNGIKSIIQFMASYDIPRIRIGIGKGKADDADEFDLGDWVLGDFTKAEKEVLTGQLERVFEAVKLICAGKIDEAMNRYN